MSRTSPSVHSHAAALPTLPGGAERPAQGRVTAPADPDLGRGTRAASPRAWPTIPTLNGSASMGMNPAKAGCVELANARNFLTWTIEQPWMASPRDGPRLPPSVPRPRFRQRRDQDALRAGAASKIYHSVLRINGKDDKAYAASNPMEYFAESSEAFLGPMTSIPTSARSCVSATRRCSGCSKTLWRAE